MGPTAHVTGREAAEEALRGPPAARPAAARRRGFTLVELTVVVAILAALASILVPSLTAAWSSAVRMRCGDNLRHIHAALNLYVQDNHDTYPCADDPVSTSPFYWLWMGRGWRGFVAPYLGRDLGPDKPSVLYCPGDPAREQYEATSYAYSMAFYHSAEQIDQMNSPADTYQDPKPSVPQGPYCVAQPQRKIIVGEWTSNHPRISGDNGWWCWEGSRNYLFVSGRVEYLPAKRIRPARDGLPNPNLTVHGIKGRDL